MGWEEGGKYVIASLSLAQPLAGHLLALLAAFAHPSLSFCVALGPVFFLFTGFSE